MEGAAPAMTVVDDDGGSGGGQPGPVMDSCGIGGFSEGAGSSSWLEEREEDGVMAWHDASTPVTCGTPCA